MIVNVVAALLGIFLIWAALRDVFQAVVLPRAVDRRLRISAYLVRFLWRIWPRLSWRIADDDKREDFLATFAPFALICILAAWVFTLVVAYGLLFYALRSQLQPQPVDFWGALYFAGTSLFTIGFGDITGRGGLARFLSLAAGASGLSVVAITTAFLFAVFGAFQRREVFVVTVGNRAGSPPSGIGLLAIAAGKDIIDDLPTLFAQAQQWTAEVMESHLAYPILSYFRSSHDYESWVGTLGTLLDAATLLLTTTEKTAHGQAQIFYWLGRHLTHDFVRYFELETHESVGIERAEFDQAYARLSQLGFEMRDPDRSWKDFSELRVVYAGALSAMAAFWQIPPLQWVGDRSLVSVQHVRDQLSEREVRPV
ncbi:MAG: two pore domain potassium channel family protein [Candidatus Eremiobacteraeota bacterium]|nr:two pore domain potassium channel family protein [Candidatus Eremiobacteraeota bacterium]